MPFQSKTQVSSTSPAADVATARKLLSIAGRGVDAAFRSLTVDTLMVRGKTTLGTLTATNVTNLARGTLAYAQVTTTQTLIGAEANLTGLSVVVSVGAGRRIKITQQTFPGASTVAPCTVTTNIKNESFVYLMQSNTTISTAGANNTVCSSVIIKPTTASTHSYFLTMQTTAGTVSNNCNVQFPSFILVEDIGT